MKRRDFLKSACSTLVAVAATDVTALADRTVSSQASGELYRKLPRWRGFNLMEKLGAESIMRVHAEPLPGNQPFREQDFAWIAEWGFDFVRLPMDYHCWVDPEHPTRRNEKALREIDQAVAWGRQYGVHVCLNQHTAPGYRVSRELDRDLWTDEDAQNEFCQYWAEFAARYRDIPPNQLSFNLVNEPAKTTSMAYAKVAKKAIAAIRREDPDRLIISDGLPWGRYPVAELFDQKVAQATRGYQPREITHYNAPWLDRKTWPKPSWPMRKNGQRLDRQWLERTYYRPWKELAARDIGVIVGEWGILDTVPYDITLHWMRDVLGIWKDAGWGWALWNLHGEHGFGPLDTRRKDVKYETFHGHRLDRKMLELLQEF